MIHKELGSIAVLGGTGIDQITPQGIAEVITPAVINSYVIFGVTVSGWVTAALALTTIVLAITYLVRLYEEVKLAVSVKRGNKQ